MHHLVETQYSKVEIKDHSIFSLRCPRKLKGKGKKCQNVHSGCLWAVKLGQFLFLVGRVFITKPRLLMSVGRQKEADSVNPYN